MHSRTLTSCDSVIITGCKGAKTACWLGYKLLLTKILNMQKTHTVYLFNAVNDRNTTV